MTRPGSCRTVGAVAEVEKLVAVVRIVSVDRGTEVFEVPADIGGPERRARLREQVSQIPHAPLQPSLAVAQEVVDDVGVLGRLGVPEQLTLPVTGERRLCSQPSKPPLVLEVGAMGTTRDQPVTGRSRRGSSRIRCKDWRACPRRLDVIDPVKPLIW